MAATESFPLCEIEGCGKQVSKRGYTLCYTHWLDSAKKADKKPATKASVPYLNSTQLGERLGLSSQRTNQVLAEIGWISKDRKGWVATAQGLKLLAEQREHHQTGVPFVIWPEAILSSRILRNTVTELAGERPAQERAEDDTSAASSDPVITPSFREKFTPTHRTTDGHWVRSKAEALIDNWLYMSGIVHAYERQLPVEEDLYCDFYLPEGKVYIEYWGLENDPKYRARKEAKRAIYAKYNFNLIELTDEHIKNLDDHLPKLLLKHNIIVS